MGIGTCAGAAVVRLSEALCGALCEVSCKRTILSVVTVVATELSVHVVASKSRQLLQVESADAHGEQSSGE